MPAASARVTWRMLHAVLWRAASHPGQHRSRAGSRSRPHAHVAGDEGLCTDGRGNGWKKKTARRFLTAGGRGPGGRRGAGGRPGGPNRPPFSWAHDGGSEEGGGDGEGVGWSSASPGSGMPSSEASDAWWRSYGSFIVPVQGKGQAALDPRPQHRAGAATRPGSGQAGPAVDGAQPPR